MQSVEGDGIHDHSSPGPAALSPRDHRRQAARAIAASAVGTCIEWYDFFLYGVAAALIFPRKYFPTSDPFTGTMLSFSTFFVGFIARPFGAALFGHFGDRAGRKASLIATLLLMGAATMAVGLVPGYDRIGIWGAVLVTLGRVLQGIGVGGEWGGSILLAGEWARPNRRGFATSWAQVGAPAGMVLANGALALTLWLTSEQSFQSWAWRIPFLFSFVLIFVGLYIRSGILETPVFAQLKAEGQIEKAPVVEVLRRNWRQVILTALLRTSQQTPFYVFTTYVLSYATQTLGMARGRVLNLVMLAATISLVTVPLSGYLSDIFGRRRITAIGCALMIPGPFVYFALLDSGSGVLISLAILLSLPVHDLQYGPQAAFISETFPANLRYSGSSLGYQLASLTAGGPAPIIALTLYRKFGTSSAVAAYLSITGIISLISIGFLKKPYEEAASATSASPHKDQV